MVLLAVVRPFVIMGLRILSFLLFLLTLLAAYGGRVNPEYLWIPSVLTLAMPYFVIATVLVTVAWFCFGRWITGAVGVLTLMFCWSPVSTAVPLNTSRPAKDNTRTFKLLTYNAIHGVDQEHPEDTASQRTFRYILDSGADIVGLQEVIDFNDPVEIPSLASGTLRDSLFKVYPYRAGTSGSDLKALSKYPIRQINDWYTHALYEVQTPWGKLHWINMHNISFNLTDEERKVMREVVSIKDTEAGLKEVNGSLKQKLKHGFTSRAANVSRLRELLDEISGPVIVSGDFNDVPESYSYRLLKGADLSDAYSQTSFGPLITYNRHGFWFHLDQVLYRENPVRALSVEKGRLRSSDHYPLMAEFEWLPQ